MNGKDLMIQMLRWIFIQQRLRKFLRLVTDLGKWNLRNLRAMVPY